MAVKKTTALRVPKEPAGSTNHLDLSKAVRVALPNLKPSLKTRPVSRRLVLWLRAGALVRTP